MGNSRALVASGSCRAARRHLTAGVTVASAGVLVLGLVAAPPDARDARNDVAALRLTAFTVPSAASLRANLENIISTQARTGLPVTPAVARSDVNTPGAVGKTATADGTTRLAVDPAIGSQNADVATLAAPIADAGLGAFLTLISPLIANPLVGPFVLFAPLIFLVVLACPPCALFNFFTFTIPSLFIPFAPLSAAGVATAQTADEFATTASTATSDSPAGDPVVTNTAAASPGSLSRTEHAGTREPATEDEKRSTETVSSTDDEAESAESDEESAQHNAANDHESSTDDSTSEPVKASVQTATRQPGVRGSVDVREQVRKPVRGGKDAHSTTQATAADDGTTTGSHSAATSSPASSKVGGNSSDGDSSDGDSGDS